MFKFIHTGDWHLGHQLYSYDREAEHVDMLRQLRDLVRAEQPHALLISGDVYHTAQPATGVQKLLTEALVQLRDACPGMHIIATAGNHDSGVKHEIFRTPWEALHVHMVGQLDKERPERHLIEVGDKGRVLALPFVHPRYMPEGMFQKFLDTAMAQGGADLPLVMMAHTAVQGLDFTGHEGATPTTVGGIDTLPLEALGSGYDYLALGHIHRPQWVQDGHGRVRYAGTPLPVSFDEDFAHTVSVVEIEAKGEAPRVREIPLTPLRPLMSLPVGEARPWEEVKAILEDFRPAQQETYLRLNVLVEGSLPATAPLQAQQLAQTKNCLYCLINPVRPAGGPQLPTQALTVAELQQESPRTLARRAAELQGLPWDEDLQSLFDEVMQQVENEARNQ